MQPANKADATTNNNSCLLYTSKVLNPSSEETKLLILIPTTLPDAKQDGNLQASALRIKAGSGNKKIFFNPFFSSNSFVSDSLAYIAEKCFKVSSLRNVRSVSYTHLDEYKRQPLLHEDQYERLYIKSLKLE